MGFHHFADDSLLSVKAEQASVDGALACLDTFGVASGAVVSPHQTYFWLIGLDSPLDWTPPAWSYIRPGVIVRDLGIPFGVGLSPVAMWDWCLQRLQSKLHVWHHKDIPFAGKFTVVGCILKAYHVYYVSCWYPN